MDAALVAGSGADGPAFAFASGYQCALRALVPSLPADHRAALCATEDGGGHPRAIKTRLSPDGDRWTLSGSKRFVTLGTLADTLLVVATLGDGPDGRPRLKLVTVPASAPGVTVTAMEPLPVVPELPHATLALDGVRVDSRAVAPEDGYVGYLKPFRTVEDLHVIAAALGLLLGLARRTHAPEALTEEALTAAAAARALATEARPGPGTHLALAGLLRALEALLARMAPCMDALGEDEAARWRRDLALLSVAGRAREARREGAWRALRGG
ncbi:MAG: acyl-CoA dehydrogenase family protein [Deltaproteobacteria bacterium]|nr:acyl-CoA dehydrogenase family protein [Deltaproteobacteria bacterium]